MEVNTRNKHADLRLVAEPDCAQADDYVTLRLEGHGAYKIRGGLATEMWSCEADRLLYILLAKSSRGGARCINLEEKRPYSIPRVGVLTPVLVRVPPVEPGCYVLRRRFLRPLPTGPPLPADYTGPPEDHPYSRLPVVEPLIFDATLTVL